MANLKLNKFSIKHIACLVVGLLIAVTVFAELSKMKSSPCSIDALENHSLKDQELDFLVIGHAYGIPKNIYLAEKLSVFLNKQNLWSRIKVL